MCSIIMSIKPQYVKRIFSGEKKYEFRKRMCRRHIDRIYIYSTNPDKRIVGEAAVDSVIIDTPSRMWDLTNSMAGIERKQFDNYYRNYDIAVAYKLVNVVKYDVPKTLEEIGLKTAPQSFQYLDM